MYHVERRLVPVLLCAWLLIGCSGQGKPDTISTTIDEAFAATTTAGAALASTATPVPEPTQTVEEETGAGEGSPTKEGGPAGLPPGAEALGDGWVRYDVRLSRVSVELPESFVPLELDGEQWVQMRQALRGVIPEQVLSSLDGRQLKRLGLRFLAIEPARLEASGDYAPNVNLATKAVDGMTLQRFMEARIEQISLLSALVERETGSSVELVEDPVYLEEDGSEIAILRYRMTFRFENRSVAAEISQGTVKIGNYFYVLTVAYPEKFHEAYVPIADEIIKRSSKAR